MYQDQAPSTGQCPESRSEMSKAIFSLEESLDELSKTVFMLKNKMEPVLVPPSPQIANEDNKKIDMNMCSPVVAKLREFNSRVRDYNSMVDCLIKYSEI